MMALRRRGLLGLALGGWGGLAPAWGGEPAPLWVVVDSAVQLPQARLRAGRVIGGLQHDLALELGRRLRREVRFRALPRRRVAPALVSGDQADLICNYLPAWLPGPLQWSRPFLDDGELLVTARRGPAPARLQDVADRRIGTIAGFAYPQVQALLGSRFLRDDGPSLESTLRKLAAGRIDHALVGRTSFDYLQRRGEVGVALHPPLVIARWRTACALSPQAPVGLAELEGALTAMQADGSLERIAAGYR